MERAFCAECGWELKPAPARFDGEPAIVGYLPCPQHPHTTVIYSNSPQTIPTTACRVCGKTGTGMIPNYYYIGGQGDMLLYECPQCLEARRAESAKACEAINQLGQAAIKELAK